MRPKQAPDSPQVSLIGSLFWVGGGLYEQGGKSWKCMRRHLEDRLVLREYDRAKNGQVFGVLFWVASAARTRDAD